MVADTELSNTVSLMCRCLDCWLTPSVLVTLRSGDSIGDREVRFDDGGTYQFRGRRIRDAVIDSLMAHHGLVRSAGYQPGLPNLHASP
jgi:hypothetical protein